MATDLGDPPPWLGAFADHLIGRHHPARACLMITALGRLLTQHPRAHPQRLLEHAAKHGGPFARTLEDFFVSHRMAIGLDHQQQQATARRGRRIDAVPSPLRPAVASFAHHQLEQRQRAQRAGTRRRGHATIESHLTTARDLARFVAGQRDITDWATVSVGDIEAFLAQQPSTRAHRLGGLRQFFAFAARRRFILTDPTDQVTASQPWGFRGPTLARDQQRHLFDRWTSNHDVHPHEALVGLLALLHGATTQEIRHLTLDAIDHTARATTLTGRPQPTPLDPWSWTAIENCLAHRAWLASTNPHLLITRHTKATRAPASDGYVKHTLDPLGIGPRILRSTRLTALVTTVDPKLVATAYGMTNDAITAYLADHVDPTHLANP
jgi:site-specific recombinase XerD